MAIIVEEEKKKGSGAAIFVWFVAIVLIAVAAYYIFFATPAVVTVPPPDTFTQLTSLASITVTPEGVISSTPFEALKTYVPEPSTSTPASIGRPNPFLQP